MNILSTGWIPQPSSGVSKRAWLLEPGEYWRKWVNFSFFLSLDLKWDYHLFLLLQRRTALQQEVYVCHPYFFSLNGCSVLYRLMSEVCGTHFISMFLSFIVGCKSISFYGEKCVLETNIQIPQQKQLTRVINFCKNCEQSRRRI